MNFETLRSAWSGERVARWLVIGLLIYWAIYVLVAPVTVSDSQTYNLSRLLVMREGGLFNNPLWNGARQAFFPLSYDSIHYVFLFIGFGYALPSYFCFLGLLLVIHKLVSERYGTANAWWCCLAMLALPTLVFQATSTKNDIPMVFGVACWFYALRFWTVRRNAAYLALMALASGFTAGAKTSGLPLFAICSAWTFRQIRSNRRALWQFALFLFISTLLLGSVEIYINNWFICKHILGRPSFIHVGQNHEGIRGALANAIRYLFGLVNFGFETWGAQPPIMYSSSECQTWLASRCADLLRFLHLSEAGYESHYSDEMFFFLKNRSEAGSDFGPVGMLAIACAFPAVFILPRTDIVWKLCIAGFLSFGITCYSISWMPTNIRFLLVPMVLFVVAFTLLIVREKDSQFRRRLRIPFLLLLIYSAVVFPLTSFNKEPFDIWESIAYRDIMTTREYPVMLKIIEDIKTLPNKVERPFLLLHAGPGSWSLSILQIPFRERRLDVMLIPFFTEKALKEARERAAGRPIYVLQLDREFAPETVPQLLLIRKYAEQDCALFLMQQPPVQ